MWTSLCNFLFNKFFHRPEIGFRRSNDSCDGVYGKRLKLIDRIWYSNGLLNRTNSSGSMQKENVEISDDEDCCIIAEIPRRKKPGISIAVQNPSNSTLTAAENLEGHKSWSSFAFINDLSKKVDQSEDIKEIKYLKQIPQKDVNNKTPIKKFFSTPRTSLSHGKIAKSKLYYRNQLKKKMNFLQESYRLTEKIQYIQLLQSHTKYNLFTGRPPLRSIKNDVKQIELIDLSDEKISDSEGKEVETKPGIEDQDIQVVKEIPGIKSFQDVLKIRPLNVETAIKEITSNHYNNSEDVLRLPENTISLIDDSIYTGQKTDALEEKLRNIMQITTPEVRKVECKADYYLPELTSEQERKIKFALIPEPSQEVLSQGFGLQITRQDMQTLVGLNWLNDEIINFYMNLIMERRKENETLPKVYAFNTFFYPKLVSDGYISLRRWTKQVDIFSFDIILVPIHLGMHWCMSIIDFRCKYVQYYDSVGSPNDLCLERLLLYLKAESLDKKQKIFPTNNWEKSNVKDIPQQMNGGDCGVFSCMFAEHLARDCNILFTQDDMPYFRKKMVIEILEKKLLT